MQNWPQLPRRHAAHLNLAFFHRVFALRGRRCPLFYAMERTPVSHPTKPTGAFS